MAELKPEELRKTVNPDDLEDGANPPSAGPNCIGQERVKKALELLEIVDKHFNVYIAGPQGSGKTKFAVSCLQNIALTKNPPPDLCYVENFKNPDAPRLITFPAGQAKKFSEDLPHIFDVLKFKAALVKNGKQFSDALELIKMGLQLELEEKLKANKKVQNAEKKNIRLKFAAPLEFALSFAVGEETFEISEDDFSKDHTEAEMAKKDETMSEEDKTKILEMLEKKYSGLFEELDKFMWFVYTRFIRRTQKEFEKLGQKALDNCRLQTVKSFLADVAKKYPSAREYFSDFGDEFLKNIQIYALNPMEIVQMSPDLQKKIIPRIELLTEVNIVVDNRETNGAPIVVENHPTFNRLYGYTEKFETKDGFIKPDFRNIKAGAIERANGGYLIIDARHIFGQYLAHEIWETLKRIIKNEKYAINDPRESMGLAPPSIQPEPIPLKVKIILVGDKHLWAVLNHYDPAFSPLFHKAEIEAESKLDLALGQQISCHLRQFSIDKIGKPVSKKALARILEYGMELAESQEKISMQLEKLENLILEAANIQPKSDELDLENVVTALREREFRLNLIEEKYIKEFIGKEHIKIDVQGKKVGEINGLVVTDPYGDHTFGRPVKITANVSAGKGELVSIDRDVKMTGETFDKSSMIINSWFQSRYAGKKPISLNVFLCFEQCYGGIDGDSASIAELAVIISAISKIPIRQDLAVTGSLNQKGVVQPIGGVNYKIKGFFKTCREKCFTGTQGAVMPKDNALDLMLPSEIIESARDKKFHICTVSTIEEALEILLDTKMEKIDKAVKENLSCKKRKKFWLF